MGLFREIGDIFTRDSKEEDIGMLYKSDFPAIFFDPGYTRLTDNPEFQAGIDIIADLVSNMTITLMANTEMGDERVHNGLSRKLDIEPSKYMTRKDYMYNKVKTLLIYGNQITIPEYERNGDLANLQPIEPNRVSFDGTTKGYVITIDDKKHLTNEQVLHFRLNPNPNNFYVGEGYRITLKPILDNLKQATKTKKGFMSSKFQPPVVISVNSDNKQLASIEGRDAFAKTYLENSEAGMPWIVPSEQMNIESIKPLTLKDIAINESVEIDKKTVAAVLGIPPFLLGVGSFDEKEYNNFINTKVMSIAKIIEQEMTTKLVRSPKMYIKFNHKSLLSYSMKDKKDTAIDMVKAGLMTGNEARDFIGFSPALDESLNEFVMLENYIPKRLLGDQSKLQKNRKLIHMVRRGGR